MGQVFEGRHPALNRKVAIKVIHPFLASQPRFVERFQNEAQSAASLRHPNVVQVYDFDVDDGIYFMVMEFIDGLNLAACLNYLRERRRWLQQRYSVDLLITLCAAVEYAHQRNMIHRDLKPENVMFTKHGQPIVTDFGIAKIVGAKANASLQSLGTPIYVAPEQAMGKRVDRRSDIYSLAIMLYEMITGAPPFHGHTPLEIAIKHVQQSLPPATEVNPRVSKSVELVLNRALSKNPDHRYQSCADFASALEVTQAEDQLSDVDHPADAQAKPEHNDLELDDLAEALVHYLGPFGGMIDLERIARAHGGTAAAIASSRLDTVLDQIASENEITDQSKIKAIREMVLSSLGQDLRQPARKRSKPQAPAQAGGNYSDESVPEAFFLSLEQELSTVLGPEAVRILDFDRRVKEFGFTRQSFPRGQLGELIGSISASVRDQETRSLLEAKAATVVQRV